jgi:hypothetical protein
VKVIVALLLAGLMWTGAAAAKPPMPQWRVVTADETMLTRRIVDDLEGRLHAAIPPGSPERPQLQIPIGPEALRTVSAKPHLPVLSAFTSSQVWYPLARGQKLPFSAVFAEPAPADQLRLVELLYRRPVTVAAILSEDNRFLRPALGEVTVETFSAGADINKALKQVSRAKVLLAIPDKAVFNTENIRNILLSAHRRNQGVIGFSADLVKAGALAATYSEIEDINRQVVEIVQHYVATGQLPGPQFPRYFRTIVNEPIARSLGIQVDDKVRRFTRRPGAVQ